MVRKVVKIKHGGTRILDRCDRGTIIDEICTDCIGSWVRRRLQSQKKRMILDNETKCHDPP